MRHGLLWVYIGMYAWSAFIIINSVGKPKKPTDATTAAIIVMFDVALAIGLLYIGGLL